MAQYLTKEEVRQWRSSLEKITLEEFAQRLGKEIQENKRTHDIVDMLINNEAISTTDELRVKTKTEDAVVHNIKETPKSTVETPVKAESKVIEKEETANLTFNKNLTEREKKVFNYLSSKKGVSVKAQELASVLDIPRDYIYKYIRNLRKKIAEDVLVNSAEGGFILNI